ncbi:MAG: hypothetical protein L3K19_07785 [Thermoplasmata archaeon]|nr:hypothetical protein [Thermoplasmata archaeon]
MTAACPICDEPIQEPASHCGACGFPTALSSDALKVRGEPEAPPKTERADSTDPARPLARGPSSARDAQAELSHRVAMELKENLALLRQLGGDQRDITSEMSQAALIQADGRVGEALGLLRDAQSRVVLRTAELFERRLKELGARQQTLTKEGVGADFSAETKTIHEEFDAGKRRESLERMIQIDQQLSRVEADWRGLRSLLQQIEALREASESAGSPNSEVESDLAEVRRLLQQPNVSPESLDTAAQVAARALMLLHEALPVTLEEELERHRATLANFPQETEASRQGRALHAEASRHLRRGRLADASQRLRELRRVIRSLGPVPLASPHPADEAPSGPESEATSPRNAPSRPGGTDVPVAAEDPLGRLLQKARGLAARVRTLPPDSEVAFEAASEIRRATELLRARKLEEADLTLTRLMHTLDTEHPAEA